MSLSKTILIGRAGKDPEVRTTTSGKKVASISVATSESYKDQSGEWQEVTEWHKVVLWGNSVDYIEKNLKKGMLLSVEGKNKTRSYEKDGITKYTTEVSAQRVDILEKVSGSNSDNTPPPTDDDVPF